MEKYAHIIKLTDNDEKLEGAVKDAQDFEMIGVAVTFYS